MAPSRSSRDVLAEVLAYNQGRKPKRLRTKLERMDQDVFAFFRGSNHLFAADWPKSQPPDPGPLILLCGDLHLENFGAYQTDDGDFLYDVNDFDDTAVGPCAVDLVRCTTSILLAAEMWRRTPLEATNMALSFLEQYRDTITAASGGPDGADSPHRGPGPIWELLGAEALASRSAMLDENTVVGKGGKRKLIATKKHPPVSSRRQEAVTQVIERYGETRPDPEAYKVLDVTSRIVGIGSLGARRYLILTAGGGTPETNRLLDLKEAFPSPLAATFHDRQPDWSGNDAGRVVEAQRVLQGRPTAGLAVLQVGHRSYRLREMIPEENRTKIDRFRNDPAKLLEAIKFAGQLTGRSQIRGLKHAGHGTDLAPLERWATGPALDSVLAAASRYAERALADYHAFHRALGENGARPGHNTGRSKNGRKARR